MKHSLIIFLSLILSTIAIADESTTTRPSTWAQPIELEGVGNLHRVSERLYRSAQPTALGMQNLKKLGIKTVVNLRSFHSDRGEIGEKGLGYEHLFVKAWHPEEKEVVAFLRLVAGSRHLPVLVHCQHGADRTGAMVASYRVALQGWTKEAAIKEMTDGGFNFHKVSMNISKWIQELDFDVIKKQAGIQDVKK